MKGRETMDNRPIGVFDSGLGGLTAVRKLMEIMPNEDIIYFGDTGRVPYGGRSKETITKYARQDIAFLQSFDIKAVVVACGTVSTTALEIIEDDYSLPIFGVTEAAVRKAAKLTQNNKIGLIGTKASIMSGTYEKLIKKWAPEAEVYGQACPLFVPLVENGRIHKGDVVIETVAREYLSKIKEKGADVLILGCTHYPLLTEVISEIMGEGAALVSPGEETARFVARKLKELDMLSGKTEGSRRYYVSDSTEDFARMASLFLQQDIDGSVEHVSIDSF